MILLSILVGIISLPFLLKGIKATDKEADKNEVRYAKKVMAEVAIVSLNKMEERLAASTEEQLDAEEINEVASRVAGYLRRRTADQDEDDAQYVGGRFGKTFSPNALRAERGELYHLRATRKISNETLQLLLHELDLMEALLVEKDS
ncbi:Na(+)/H(+) exchanger [Proteus mirabilis]|uniref:Na(+)/H(+) exchanger n=1 Tax=Proteus mirabilis TaxID=584 RepID=A0A379FFY9_PROMI|nr:Na(+)/H(+) exchanger [Proteus mirabilis]